MCAFFCVCFHNPPNADMDYRIFIVHVLYVIFAHVHIGVGGGGGRGVLSL